MAGGEGVKRQGTGYSLQYHWYIYSTSNIHYYSYGYEMYIYNYSINMKLNDLFLICGAQALI